MFREDPFIEQSEFELLDATKSPPAVWPIGELIPSSPCDVREWRRVSGVEDLPLATDLEKGLYCLSADGRILLRSPNVPGCVVEVAPNINVFRSFKPRIASVE